MEAEQVLYLKQTLETINWPKRPIAWEISEWPRVLPEEAGGAAVVESSKVKWTTVCTDRWLYQSWSLNVRCNHIEPVDEEDYRYITYVGAPGFIGNLYYRWYSGNFTSMVYCASTSEYYGVLFLHSFFLIMHDIGLTLHYRSRRNFKSNF